MFGHGAGWVVPLTDYSIMLAVGSIARKPMVVPDDSPGGSSERIAIREVLSLTVSVDHDVNRWSAGGPLHDAAQGVARERRGRRRAGRTGRRARGGRRS
jgi:hypothetical protein